MRPKVSIIITTYNVEKTIHESIDSVLVQTLPEIEIICIDGGSSDKTCSIIKEYIKGDKRIHLHFQQQPGLGNAKNYGIEKATGDYITFLDADDYYVDINALEKMYKACQEKQVKVCGAFRSTVFGDGTVINEQLHRADCKGHPEGVLLNYIDKQYDYHFHSYLYHREMIINSDARFGAVNAYDDTHFHIRAMLQAVRFYVVPVEMYRYRCGPAYKWGMEKANDAIKTLTDQLILSKEKHLARLHWLTMQRINYEYGPIFEANIRSGDIELLINLLAANKEVDPQLIEEVVQNPPPEREYLEPMIHRAYADMPLRTLKCAYAPQYILEPIWNVVIQGSTDWGQLYEQIDQLTKEIEAIRESRTFKLASTFAEGFRKIRKIKHMLFR